MDLKGIYRFFAYGLLIVLSGGLTACQGDKRALVVGKIQNASDLATTEFVIDKVVFGTKTKKLFFVNISEAQFLAYSKAVVKTGIDLNKISPDDITIDRHRISLRLPAIEVVNFSYPPSSFVEDSLISDTRALLNKINIRDQEEFFRMAELDIRSNLPYMGLVKTSQEHTRKMFKVLLKSLGYKEIYISFDGDNLTIPQVNLLTDQDEIVGQ